MFLPLLLFSSSQLRRASISRVMQMFRSTLRIRTYKEIVHKQATLRIEERNTCRRYFNYVMKFRMQSSLIEYSESQLVWRSMKM